MAGDRWRVAGEVVVAGRGGRGWRDIQVKQEAGEARARCVLHDCARGGAIRSAPVGVSQMTQRVDWVACVWYWFSFCLGKMYGFKVTVFAFRSTASCTYGF